MLFKFVLQERGKHPPPIIKTTEKSTFSSWNKTFQTRIFGHSGTEDAGFFTLFLINKPCFCELYVEYELYFLDEVYKHL